MRLQGRELYERLESKAVRILHQELRLLGYEIKESEQQEPVVGEDTERAVKDFQRKRGLKPTGEMDVRTARLINAAVDALPPWECVVTEKVTHTDGSPLDGLIVRVFNKDLCYKELLGKL